MKVTDINPQDTLARRRLLWRQRDGTRIAVGKMTNKHLENTIKYLREHNRSSLSDAWIRAFQCELDSRPRGRATERFLDEDGHIHTVDVPWGDTVRWHNIFTCDDVINQEDRIDMEEISEDRIEQLLADFA